MERFFERLNKLKFNTPENYDLSQDKYNLPNGQGFINTENYISNKGEVISFFEIYRESEKFFKSYKTIYQNTKQNTSLYKTFNLRLENKVFYIYILKTTFDQTFYTAQVFIDRQNCLGCLMFKLDLVNDELKEMIKNNQVFQDVIKILRSVK